jgi:hypothetical protein
MSQKIGQVTNVLNTLSDTMHLNIDYHNIPESLKIPQDKKKS